MMEREIKLTIFDRVIVHASYLESGYMQLSSYDTRNWALLYMFPWQLLHGASWSEALKIIKWT